MTDFFDIGRVKREVDQFNSSTGALNVDRTNANGTFVRGDGIDCPKCKNKGVIYRAVEDNGYGSISMRYCDCMERRFAVRRLQESGLENAISRYSLDSFSACEDWQIRMKDVAIEYIQSGAGVGCWLYIGGQSGAGKTHLCTGVAGMLLKDMDVRYIVWPRTAQKIKAVANDAEAYSAEIEPLQTVKVLYIDDFLKPVRNNNGSEAVATGADIRLAFDVLNYRYINELPTIISSEWFSSELIAIDEALAGRIIEAAGDYLLDIGRDIKRNHRLRNSVL